MNYMDNYVIYWMRRDMRLHDNHAFYKALTSGLKVMPIFIFDDNILESLPESDARVSFIHSELSAIKRELRALDCDIIVSHGDPFAIFEQMLKNDPGIRGLYYNEDYEPYAIERDRRVSGLFSRHHLNVFSFKDHVIYDGSEILKSDGKPYTVFTPYKRRWMERLQMEGIKAFPSEDHLMNVVKSSLLVLPTLAELGFNKSDLVFPSKEVERKVIRQYDQTRNFPALEKGTSRLGVHFRFGTISIRKKALSSIELNQTYLNELIWRDFYSQILYHFPHVVTQSYKPAYDNIQWSDDREAFDKWCRGLTGYPLVDAGMRELNTTGYMHNRVRMVVASFLTKHLLIDWRWGEAYFAEKLLDYDLASNNGGWQWAAGSGTDAAPYFRIFNPQSQLEKFDKDYKYVKKWIPEWGSSSYPEPIVDHKLAREKCLNTYKAALQ